MQGTERRGPLARHEQAVQQREITGRDLTITITTDNSPYEIAQRAPCLCTGSAAAMTRAQATLIEW